MVANVVANETRTIAIGLGELSAARLGELVAFSLGSCVAICLYDPGARVAGMVHVVLPLAPVTSTTPGRYADTAVPALLSEMQRAGARSRSLQCRIAGGAAVLKLGGGGSLPDIGKRNIEAVKSALKLAGVPILAEATGGNKGRTVRLDAESGRVLVRSVQEQEVEL